MIIILFGKLFVGGVFTAIASTLVALNWDKIIGSPYRDIVVYAKTDNINDPASADIDTQDDSSKNNYQCRWAKTTEQTNENKLFECAIKQLKEDTSSSKKHFDKDADLEAAQKEKLKAAGTMIQISFKSNKYEWQYEGKDKIEIVSTSTSAQDEGKKYGTAGIWFLEEKDKEIKTTQFIGQADKESKSGETLSDYKCSWTEKAGDLKECKIFPFVASNSTTDQKKDDKISSLTFAKTDAVSTEIKINHYYLIEFTNNEDNTKDLESLVLGDLIYAKDASVATDTKVTFSKISAVTVVENQLLILKKHQEA